MPLAYNDRFIDDIRQRADIVEVVSQYVKLEAKGKNYLGLCPFHQEKTPSFNVQREKQLYYCFGCGAGGDVFNFLMEMENLPFIEAAKILAERYGVPIPDQPMTEARRKEDEVREQLFEIHEWTAKFYHYLLTQHPTGRQALAYFQGRGFTPGTMEKFRLGYSPHQWTALYDFLKGKHYSDAILNKSGLLLPRKDQSLYDRFRDRAMFTICNLRGQPIGFGGRVMKAGENPKYLNSPETLLFEKNQNLYALNFARESFRHTRRAIIMEGYTDVITAHQHGIENAIASLGTALTENQARLLARHVDEVYISYDADTAGQNATLRGLDILREAGLMVKVVRLPEGKDPDELIRNRGAEAFLESLEHAVSLIDFKLERTLGKFDLANPDGKVKAVEELLPLFLNIDNAIERDYLIEQMVERIRISRHAVEEELAYFMEEKSKIKDKPDRKWHTKEEGRKPPRDARVLFEEKFLNAMLRRPDLIGKILNEIRSDAFRTPEYRAIVTGMEQYVQDPANECRPLQTTNQLIDLFTDEATNVDLLRLSFLYQEYEITDIFIHEGLKKLKEYQKAMEMETILKEINQIKKHGNLTDLNQVLIRYHRMLHRDSGKGGC